MGRIKKIKKLCSALLAVVMITITMSGCVYANNKDWDEMTPKEQEEVRQSFFDDVKSDLESDSSRSYLEERFLKFIFDKVGQRMENKT